MSFKVGNLVGVYRIVKPLGKGGMGEVYEVEHERLGVRLALKAFALAGKDRAFLRKRFVAEGRVLARISDPRIVHVVDLDVEPGTDTPYFVMNLVTGPNGAPRTLADESAQGGIDERRLLGWYEDLRQALAVVHAAGVVHRDIKPENVLVDAEGRAVLSDFGVCRIVDDRLREQLAVTRTMASSESSEMQAVLGTVAYLSPEVRAGAEPTAAAQEGSAQARGPALFAAPRGARARPASEGPRRVPQGRGVVVRQGSERSGRPGARALGRLGGGERGLCPCGRRGRGRCRRGAEWRHAARQDR